MFLSCVYSVVTIGLLLFLLGNPFNVLKGLFEGHVQKHVGESVQGINVYSLDKENKYFIEFPFGISGVIYEGIVYIYDKTKMTKCGDSPYYESVFQVQQNDDKLNSKCFLSHALIRNIFANSSLQVLPPVPHTTGDFKKRVMYIVDRILSL